MNMSNGYKIVVDTGSNPCRMKPSPEHSGPCRKEIAMTALILIVVAFVGFKLGQAVVRAGRAMNLPGFGQGRILFNVNN